MAFNNGDPAVDIRGQINQAILAAAIANKAPNILNFIPENLHSAIRDGTNTTDLSSYVNTALATSPKAIDLCGLTILVKQPIEMLGLCSIVFNGGTIKAQMTTATDPIFRPLTVDSGAAQVVTLTLLGFGIVRGPHTAVSFKLTGGISNSGLKLVSHDIAYVGYNSTSEYRTAGTKAFDLEMVDFVTVRGGSVFQYDKVMHVTGNAAGDAIGRTNTQILVDNLAVMECNQVFYGDSMSNCEFKQFDASHVGGGFVIGNNVTNVNFHQPVCAIFAEFADRKNDTDIAAGTAKYGYAFYIKDNSKIKGLEVNKPSFNPSTNTTAGSGSTAPGTPVGGIYVGRTSGSVIHAGITFRDGGYTTITPSNGNYKWLENHGRMVFDGYWPTQTGSSSITTASGDFLDQYVDLVVYDKASRCSGQNLLPGTKAINLRQKTGSGTVAVTEETTNNYVSRGHTVTFTASSTTQLYELLQLEPGWYTYVISAYYDPAFTNNIYASVFKDSDNSIISRTGLRFPIVTSTHETFFHLPIGITESGLYRVGFQCSINGAAVVGSMGFFRGFYPSCDIPRGGWDFPPILDSNFPTASAFWEGRAVTRDYGGSGSDNTVEVAVRTTSGHAWKVLT